MTQKINEEQWKKLIKIIKEEKNFVIATHIFYDGDSLGSTIALKFILDKMGKNAIIAADDMQISAHYSFLPGIGYFNYKIEQPEKPYIFIALDCGGLKRLGRAVALVEKTKYFINIDHHNDNEKFANLNLIDSDVSSTSELIYDMSRRLNMNLDKDIALCMYVGIVTDTGRFQYENTKAKTFLIAKELLKYDIRPEFVFRNVYESQKYETLRFIGHAMAKANLIPELDLIYTEITKEEASQNQGLSEEIERLIENLRSVKEAEIAVVFLEMSGERVKVSLRSSGKVDVSHIAGKFCGGGHLRAAGFIIKSSLEESKQYLFECIKKYSKNKKRIGI